ncbi:unnamed protein product [Rhizophagus irregularis]|nr:unnamed protein product [Rhizophagus irregularis]
MEKLTINAHDWETSNAATMARRLLFSVDKAYHFEDYCCIIFAWYHIALVDSHYDAFKELVSSFRLLAALCGGKGSLPRDQVENLVEKRYLCLRSLKKIGEEYRSKSDDMRVVLELCEREYL